MHETKKLTGDYIIILSYLQFLSDYMYSTTCRSYGQLPTLQTSADLHEASIVIIYLYIQQLLMQPDVLDEVLTGHQSTGGVLRDFCD